jgi:hypothetical protein
MQDMSRPGVWRQRGIFRPEYPIPKEAHSPISVMVWGAISFGGSRSRLLRCPNHIKAESYKKIVENARIVDDFDQVFEWAKKYQWQQDNAPRIALQGEIRDLLRGWTCLIGLRKVWIFRQASRHEPI